MIFLFAYFAPRHQTYSHRKWAKAIKKKFKGKCALTGQKGGGQAHHLY